MLVRFLNTVTVIEKELKKLSENNGNMQTCKHNAETGQVAVDRSRRHLAMCISREETF
jgi:hypothetical protein